MLKTEVNELLTQTGPGTPTGDLFRQYWLPALLAEELPEDDCPPVRVKILSERLIAFRDSEGRYGLIDEFCAHRGVSLWFGRVEESGLRCAYHGWKYDVTGQCVEVPSEPENSNFCKKVKLTAYPLVKVGDILWTHLGDPAKRPELPEFEFLHVPPEQTYTSKRWQESNWLQALEGGIDSSHVSWLHSGGLKSDPLFKGAKGNEYNLNDLRPFFEVANADGGLFIGARRNAEDDRYYWRITPWVMPSFTIVPPRGDHPVHGHFWVPIDDENCWAYTFDYHPTRALTAEELRAMKDGHGVHSRNIPGTYRPQENKDNDYLMDREAQKRGEAFSGVRGIAQQDASLQESMGPIVDRTKERLVSSDTGIIKARQKLRKAVIALRDESVTPPGVDPAHHRVRSAAIVLPQEESFIESTREAVAVRPRRGAHLGVTAPVRPTLLNSCAKAATAAEARFRIDRPIAGRSARIVALDEGAAEVVRRVAAQPWRGARFFTCEARTSAVNGNSGKGGSAGIVLRATDGSESALAEELADADVAIMIATAGDGAEAASAIAQACTLRGIMTAGLILGARLEVGAAVSALRPYARVLMVTDDEDDVSEVLTALRA